MSSRSAQPMLLPQKQRRSSKDKAAGAGLGGVQLALGKRRHRSLSTLGYSHEDASSKPHKVAKITGQTPNDTSAGRPRSGTISPFSDPEPEPDETIRALEEEIDGKREQLNHYKAEKRKRDDPESSKPPIKFKDAVGRKFSFPWRLCKKWKGMETLIKQAFLHVDVIGDHVHQGHYDLTGPDGEIILPQVWDAMIQPGWEITMHLWPMEEETKPKAPGLDSTTLPPPPVSWLSDPSGGYPDPLAPWPYDLPPGMPRCGRHSQNEKTAAAVHRTISRDDTASHSERQEALLCRIFVSSKWHGIKVAGSS